MEGKLRKRIMMKTFPCWRREKTKCRKVDLGSRVNLGSRVDSSGGELLAQRRKGPSQKDGRQKERKRRNI